MVTGNPGTATGNPGMDAGNTRKTLGIRQKGQWSEVFCLIIS
jgi:hypothetical protein